MSTTLDLIPSHLTPDAEGIWRGAESHVSYPEDGHSICLGVEDGSFWFRHRNQCILSAVRRFSPGGVLLDIGGGNGFVSRFLSAHDQEVILLEPGIEGARSARRRGIDTVIQSSLESAGFAESVFPAAGLFDVLEHLPDDGGALREIWRILKPGGMLFVTVPAYPCLFSDEDRQAGHMRRYTKESLRRVLENSGFDILLNGSFFLFLPIPILLLRTIPSWVRRLLGRPLSDRPEVRHVKGAWTALDSLWNWEARAIGNGIPLPVGGSILAVARKAPVSVR